MDPVIDQSMESNGSNKGANKESICCCCCVGGGGGGGGGGGSSLVVDLLLTIKGI